MRATLVFVCSLLLAASVLACSSAPRATTCASGADCPGGQLCVDSRCVPSGGDAGICRLGCQCTTVDTCLAGAPPCVEAACVSGSCFFRTNDSRCAAGQTCDVLVGCTAGTTDAGMRDASSVADAGGDTGPPDAFAIDMGPPDTNTRSPLGGPCSTNGDCAPIIGPGGTMAMCATMQGGAPLPGGYCTVLCSAFIGAGTCPAGSECVQGRLGGRQGFCAVTCVSPRQCRTYPFTGPAQWRRAAGMAHKRLTSSVRPLRRTKVRLGSSFRARSFLGSFERRVLSEA